MRLNDSDALLDAVLVRETDVLVVFTSEREFDPEREFETELVRDAVRLCDSLRVNDISCDKVMPYVL